MLRKFYAPLLVEFCFQERSTDFVGWLVYINSYYEFLGNSSRFWEQVFSKKFPIYHGNWCPFSWRQACVLTYVILKIDFPAKYRQIWRNFANFAIYCQIFNLLFQPSIPLKFVVLFKWPSYWISSTCDLSQWSFLIPKR